MSFAKIAHIYNQYNDQTIYEDWLDFTLNYLDSPKVKVLDLGCGTGYFTQLLAPFCQEIIGLDSDEGMLEIAQQTNQFTQLSFVHGDMLDLSTLDTQFQLITCYADTLCFLKNERQLATALKEIYKQLDDNGIFLYDVWTPYQIQEGFNEFSYHDSDNQSALLWDSHVDEESLGVSHYLTVFESEEISNHSSYRRTDLVLEEKTYELAVYLKCLRQAGFRDLEVLVDFGNENFDPKIHGQQDRWFFVARK